jgi:hypothetical protein
VEIRQAVLGDRATVNDIKSHADDARIAGRKGNKLPHDVSGLGDDLAMFVNALHPQTPHSPMRPKLSGVLASGARGVAREERTGDLNGS